MSPIGKKHGSLTDSGMHAYLFSQLMPTHTIYCSLDFYSNTNKNILGLDELSVKIKKRMQSMRNLSHPYLRHTKYCPLNN